MKEANRLRFRVEDRLYQEFKMFHLNFLEVTQYFKVQDIKEFIILLIGEWYTKLKEENKLIPYDPDKIAYINRVGKRTTKLPYEGDTARMGLYFKEPIETQWNDIVYTLMSEDEFANMKEYSNGYFFPYLYNFAKENINYLTDKYKKHSMDSINLKMQDEVIIKFINKASMKHIEGKVAAIENTPEGLIIHIDRVNI